VLVLVVVVVVVVVEVNVRVLQGRVVEVLVVEVQVVGGGGRSHPVAAHDVTLRMTLRRDQHNLTLTRDAAEVALKQNFYAQLFDELTTLQDFSNRGINFLPVFDSSEVII
jgi:hypothetical protein